MIRTLTVFGTRPEAIKMAPLVKALNRSSAFDSVVCVTAQHREMLDQVLDLFEIRPDVDLNLMKPNQDLFDVTAGVLLAVRDVLKKYRPDLVFVQGDTTTTFTTALAAFYLGIPIAHVEAGLRTGNLAAPFPEEANRCLTTRLADLHFCPTKQNRVNLLAEGTDPDAVYVTGNTVIDALLWVKEKVKDLPAETWKHQWGTAAEVVAGNAPVILMTGHRRENFGQGIRNICQAVSTLASRHEDWHFIYPVHLNPNVLKPVREMLNGHPNIHLIEPLDYAPFVFLMNRARLLLTDSGGVQEEGPSLGKPVLVMRETTERPEALDAGTVRLVGTDCELIAEGVESVMTDESLYRSMARAINPYGDGTASSVIIEVVADWKIRPIESRNQGAID